MYIDLDDNDDLNNGDDLFAGATVVLNGTDTFGNTVSMSMTTDPSGDYAFIDLEPGTYEVMLDTSTIGNLLSDSSNAGMISSVLE